MTIDELKDIALQGEGYKIEFKESSEKAFVEEVTAFANASGGRIFLGIADNGKIKGVDTSNASRSKIQDAISQIKPSISVDIEIVDNVFVIHVPEGKDKPYACSKGFYLRMGANSQKLERDDIIEFFQSEGKNRFDEIVIRTVDFQDNLDSKAYTHFIKRSGISDVIEQEDLLLNLDCIKRDYEERLRYTNAGVLFFTKNPIEIIKHASVVCALYKGTDKITILDRKAFVGNIIANIEDAFLFLQKHLNLRYEFEGLRRIEILDIPEIALRESIVNAVCHRDYFEKGAQVMIEIFDDRVVISNPGGLPKGIESKNFGKLSMSRNPIIASLLQRSDYIEKMGTGIRKIYNAMLAAGLPEPEFDTEGFFVVTFKRESYLKSYSAGDRVGESSGNNVGDSVGESVGDSVGDNREALSELQEEIIKLLKENPKLAAIKLKKIIGISSRNIERNLSQLKKMGILKRVGPDYGGQWEVKEREK